MASLTSRRPAVSLSDLPPMPAPSLDPLLDAASRCFAKYGLGRTSVQDVASELGVNRTTVYRQAGPIEEIASMLAIRDCYRLLLALPARVAGLKGPDAIVELIATLIEESRSHPVLAKMLADEPTASATLAFSYLPQMVGLAVDTIAPLVAEQIRLGNMADSDPEILAEWLLRIGVTLVLIEPRAKLRPFLREILRPALAR